MIVALLAFASPARADSQADYRVEVGTVAVGGPALFATGWALDDNAVGAGFVLAGLAACQLGAPVTHAVEGNWGRAGISLAAHVALPLAVVVVASKNSRDFDFNTPVKGFVVGHLLAAVLDVALAYGSAPADTTAPRIVSLGGRF